MLVAAAALGHDGEPPLRMLHDEKARRTFLGLTTSNSGTRASAAQEADVGLLKIYILRPTGCLKLNLNIEWFQIAFYVALCY